VELHVCVYRARPAPMSHPLLAMDDARPAPEIASPAVFTPQMLAGAALAFAILLVARTMRLRFPCSPRAC
jgi:hypothetical protein